MRVFLFKWHRGALHVIDLIMNGAKYRDILQEHLHSSVQQLNLGDDRKFQQDNDPKIQQD